MSHICKLLSFKTMIGMVNILLLTGPLMILNFSDCHLDLDYLIKINNENGQ